MIQIDSSDRGEIGRKRPYGGHQIPVHERDVDLGQDGQGFRTAHGVFEGIPKSFGVEYDHVVIQFRGMRARRLGEGPIVIVRKRVDGIVRSVFPIGIAYSDDLRFVFVKPYLLGTFRGESFANFDGGIGGTVIDEYDFGRERKVGTNRYFQKILRILQSGEKRDPGSPERRIERIRRNVVFGQPLAVLHSGKRSSSAQHFRPTQTHEGKNCEDRDRNPTGKDGAGEQFSDHWF